MQSMNKKDRITVDCRDYPSELGCTLAISGKTDEVMQAAVQHAVAVHGEKDTPELRQWLKDHSKKEQGGQMPGSDQPMMA